MIVCEGVFMRHAEITEIIFCKCLRYLREKSLPPLASVFLALERLARAC